MLNGSFNQTQYGYNHVTRIPAGSSSLDIRQKGYQGSNHDDNYLALMDPQTGEYLLNGNFVVSVFQKTIQFGGTTIEYSGSDAVMERLNSSKPLKKDVVIQVDIDLLFFLFFVFCFLPRITFCCEIFTDFLFELCWTHHQNYFDADIDEFIWIIRVKKLI